MRRFGSIPVTERVFRVTGLISAAAMLLILVTVAACNGGQPKPEATTANTTATAVAQPSPSPEPGDTSTDIPAPTPTVLPAATPTPAPTRAPTRSPAADLPAVSAFPEPVLFQVPVAPTPVPPEVPTGPFPTPTPRPTKNVNLVPFAGGERGPGLVVSGDNGSGFYNAENVVISWWITNVGQYATNEVFDVEIRLDDVSIKRWTTHGLSPNWSVRVEDVGGILSGLRPTAGIHELSLVIDPTHRVPEIVTRDNRLDLAINFMEPPPLDVPEGLRPNLAPALVTGKNQPLFASSYPEDLLSGKLSIDHQSYVSFAAQNESIQYISETVDLHIYVDDVLAESLQWNGLSPASNVFGEIDDLRELIDISPGPHRLKLVVDPLNRVPESNESDNGYEAEFVWGVGDPAPAETPFTLTAPERIFPTMPNLVPYRPFGWDAAIVLRQSTGLPGMLVEGKYDTWLDTKLPFSIDFSFTNASVINTPLSTELHAVVLIDGIQVKRQSFNLGSNNGNATWTPTIEMTSTGISAGEHTVRVVLDPDRQIDEFNEDDNIFERTFTFHDGPAPAPPEPFSMSDDQISSALAPLLGEMMQQVKPLTGLGSGSRDWTPEILAAAQATYFLMTGKDLNEEGYVIRLLPHREFRTSYIQSCMAGWMTLTDEEYIQQFDACNTKTLVGFKTRMAGQIYLFIDSERSPADVLSTLLHEIGHALQDLRNPKQTTMRSTEYSRGLKEAQAEIFEAAAWRFAEKYLGVNLSQFPDLEQSRDRLQFLFDSRNALVTEHDMGYVLLWTQALTDTHDLNLSESLRTNGILNAQEALELYEYLVGITPYRIEEWAANLLSQDDLIAEFQQIAISRLVKDLPLELTANPAMQDSAWTAP